MIDNKLRIKQLIALAISIILLFMACAWSVTSGEYHMSISTFFKLCLAKANIQIV